MRSRGPSRRSAVQQPVTDQALPQHYESSKKYDDDPSAVTGRQEKRMGFWKRLIKQWYKSEQQPICGDLSNADAGLTPKQSSSLSLAVPAVVGLVMAGTILYLLLLALQDGSSRPERRFPVKVYLEGATPLPIGSISSRPLDLPILIESVVASPSQFKYPQPLDAQASEEARLKDYANLEIFLMAESNVARVIYRDEWDEIGEVRDMSIRDDDIDAYYSFDDDELRSPYKRYDDEAMKNGDNRCRRVAWHRYQFPNCNTFHELNSAVNVPRYISYGAYRDVFAHVHKKPGKSDVVVWKQSSYKPDVDFTYDMYEFTRMDAIVSERLTSRKRIVDIYGHCGLSVLAEFMASGDLEDATIPGEGYIKQKDLHDEDDVKPQNHFCAEDKLLIALEMAESLALLHDFPDGVIVHDDVQLSQFLYDPNGTIKLNDFNRAEIMLWDDEREQYCRYRNNPGNGNVSSRDCAVSECCISIC